MGEALLAKYLKAHKETQSGFASRAGVSASALSDWLSGRRSPDVLSASLVAAATAGEVPAECWARRDRRRRKKAS